MIKVVVVGMERGVNYREGLKVELLVFCEYLDEGFKVERRFRKIFRR